MSQLRPILLVEDSLNDIELVLAALKKNKFANEVIVARDGEEAMEYLHGRGSAEQAAEYPLVVLLDLKMPRKDGLEVLREMKDDERLKRIPVVMLTSSREEQDLIRSYKLGANAYVVKPVDFRSFIDAVRQLGAFWAVVNEPPPGGAVHRT